MTRLRAGVGGMTAALLFAAFTATLQASEVSAQAPEQARQAAYSADQAEAGAAVYRAACGACHLPNLAGSFEAPELAGPNFRNTWGARSVSDLVELMSETMPPEAPGSLDEGQYVALAAFMLRQNGVAPAQARLSLSSSGRVIGGTGAVGATAAGGVEPTVRPPVPRTSWHRANPRDPEFRSRGRGHHGESHRDHPNLPGTQKLHPGLRRGSRESARRRLAPLARHTGSAGLQPSCSDHLRERPPPQPGLGLGHGARNQPTFVPCP